MGQGYGETVAICRVCGRELKKCPSWFDGEPGSAGWDAGPIRIKGGRTIYEAVMFCCGGRQKMVLLAYLVPTERGIKQINRYVQPDTMIEIMEPVGGKKDD